MSNISEIIENMKEAQKSGLQLAFAYDRIRAEVQSDGISLEYQSNGAEKYARERGLFIIHNFCVIESASKEGRKVFNEMIDLALNFGVKNLIFKNTDRMSRNYQDLVRIEKLIDKESFNIHFHQSQLVINQESSYNDRFLIGIQLAVAKHLSDKISQDVKEHNMFKAKKGVSPGPPPFGYKYDRKERIHRINREEQGVCRYIFETYDRGSFSLNDFVDHLNAKGVKTRTGKGWRKGPLHHMLTNPFYHGEFLYKEQVWSGNHEPYYEKDRYVKRLERLSGNYVGRKKRNFEFSLAGHLRCSCGRQLTGQKKKGRYVYYTHTCARTGKKEAIREEVVFANLDAAIRDFRFSPNFAHNMKGLFQHVGQNQQRNVDSERDEVCENITYIEEKKSKLYDLFLEREIDRDLLRKKIDELDHEVARLENGKQSYLLDSRDLLEKACDLIDSMHEQPAIFLKSGDYYQKAAILRAISEQVVMSKAAATIEWKTPYSHLLESDFLELKGACEEKKAPEADGSNEEDVQASQEPKPEREAANAAIPAQSAVNRRDWRFSGLSMLPNYDEAVTNEAMGVIINLKMWQTAKAR